MFQPAAYTGYGGGPLRAPTTRSTSSPSPTSCAPPRSRRTGLLRKSDFLPLPCSHPGCFGLTYLLKTDDGFVPVPALHRAGPRTWRSISNRGTIRPDARFEDAIQRDDRRAVVGSGPDPRQRRRSCATLKKAHPADVPRGPRARAGGAAARRRGAGEDDLHPRLHGRAHLRGGPHQEVLHALRAARRPPDAGLRLQHVLPPQGPALHRRQGRTEIWGKAATTSSRTRVPLPLLPMAPPEPRA